MAFLAALTGIAVAGCAGGVVWDAGRRRAYVARAHAALVPVPPAKAPRRPWSPGQLGLNKEDPEEGEAKVNPRPRRAQKGESEVVIECVLEVGTGVWILPEDDAFDGAVVPSTPQKAADYLAVRALANPLQFQARPPLILL